MADIDFDIDLEEDPDCACDLEEDCCDDGCLFRIKVGPCEALDQSNGAIDLSMMCTPNTVNAHTPNFIRPLREKTRRNSCRKRRFRGTPDCNVDIDIDFCQTDPAMKYLLGDCPMALCMIPRADLFDASIPVDQQGIVIMRGLFIGSNWTWNNEFEECQSTSRNFSCTGTVWGMKQWLDAIPDIAGLTRNELEVAA